MIPSPYNPAAQEYDRLRNGHWSARPDFGPYHLITAPADDRPYAAILYNRLGINGVAIDAAHRGTGKLLWTGIMPPGDPACVVIAYPAGTTLPR